MATITDKLNSKLEIKIAKNLKFASGNDYVLFSGHALFIAGYGYLRFAVSSNKQDNEFKTPYSPMGGRKALKSIISAGGLLTYDGMEFVNPSKQ